MNEKQTFSKLQDSSHSNGHPSPESLGSFHLIHELYEEYIFLIIEHKVALVIGETPIAVIGGKYNEIRPM